MSAVTDFVSYVTPPWMKWAALALLLAAVTGWHLHKVGAAYDEGHAAAVTERAAADLAATVNQVIKNQAEAVRQRADNVDITKVKNEELAPVVARIDAAPRMRRPSAICDSAPVPPKAPSAAGSDSADSPGRLGEPNAGRDLEPQVIREDIDRDFKAYKIAVEKDLATGRTCQAFLDKNGLVP